MRRKSRARRPEDRKSEEARALARAYARGREDRRARRTRQVDEQRGFASQIGAWRDAGLRDLCFVIGGADGLDASLRNEAALTLSFGALTLPHQIVRALVAEQIYRAISILAGHPYHRA